MKTWIILLAAILVGSNLYWFGKFFDAGITYSYAVQESGDNLRALDAAVTLANLNLIGLSAAEARLEIDRVWRGAPIIEKPDGCIYVESICVQLDTAGNVVTIKP
jgi:hypothetical protein